MAERAGRTIDRAEVERVEPEGRGLLVFIVACIAIASFAGGYAFHRPEITVRGGGSITVDCESRGVSAMTDCLTFTDPGCNVTVRNVDCYFGEGPTDAR